MNQEEELEKTEPVTIEENSSDNLSGDTPKDSSEDRLTTVVEGYSIESDIEIPPIRQRKSNIWFKIANSMKINQSVFFPEQKDGNAFKAFLHKNDITYTSRSEGEGIRVWKLRKQNKKELQGESI